MEKLLEVLLDMVMDMELDLKLELYITHLTVPPGIVLLLVHMTCSFIPDHIMMKNEDEDDYIGKNNGQFQRIEM